MRVRVEAEGQVGRLVGNPGFDFGGTSADGTRVVVVSGGGVGTIHSWEADIRANSRFLV